MTVPSEASSGGSSGNWLFKNKEHGKASAAASLVSFSTLSMNFFEVLLLQDYQFIIIILLQGMILLWDVDSGLAQIDKYFHSNDNHVIAGALLGVGIVNCGIKNDCDPVSSH